MSIEWGRVAPVLVSIAIIIAVAILRQYSRTLAAIIATMPVNIPLALWIASDNSDQAQMVEFTENLVIGLPPTVVFIVVAWLIARAGGGLLPMLAGGYLAWAISLALAFGLRALLK